MYNAPYMYDYINQCTDSRSPSTVRVQNTALFRYFMRYYMQRAMSVFKWSMPDTWVKDYFLYVLYTWGWLAVFNTDKFGVIPQQCGLEGYDVFYRPTHAVITNPLFNQVYRLRIGKQCTLIKLQPDYGGVWDIVSTYAEMSALALESAGINLVNSKFAYVFMGKNKTEAESFKKMYDNIASGEPAVFVDKRLINEDGTPNWMQFNNNVAQSYITSDILSDIKKIEAMFDTAIGIPNANTDKKERQIVSEVASNNIQTISTVSVWLEELQERVDEAKQMFGITDFSVDWRFPPEGGGLDGTDSINLGLVPTGQNPIRQNASSGRR